MLESLQERARQLELTRRLRILRSPEGRFWLSLLRSVPDRQLLLELVSQRFDTTDPVETFLGVLEELASQRLHLSCAENVLGLRGYDDGFALVLELMLQGRSGPELRDCCLGEYPMLFSERSVEQTVQAVHESPLFCRLWADPEGSDDADPSS